MRTRMLHFSPFTHRFIVSLYVCFSPLLFLLIFFVALTPNPSSSHPFSGRFFRTFSHTPGCVIWFSRILAVTLMNRILFLRWAHFVFLFSWFSCSNLGCVSGWVKMVVFEVVRVETTPFDGQKPGTSGLRKKVSFLDFFCAECESVLIRR